MQNNIPLLNKGFHDINPVVCGWEDCEKGHFFGPAIREYYLIHFIMSGTGIYQRAKVTYNLSKGSMFLIYPHEPTFYKADTENPWSYVWIGFTGALALELLKKSGFSEECPVVYSPACSSIFKSMTETKKMRQTAEIYLCGKIYELFAHLEQESSLESRTALIYAKRAENFIQSNYMNNISISGIADMLGIDRRYLFRVFTEYTGVSPQTYLVNYRLEKAAQLLAGYGCPVSEVARSCGYSDMFNFSNMFKKKYGMSPSKYKNANI